MIALAFALALWTAPQEIPEPCRTDGERRADWAACAALFPEGTPGWRLATLNRASEAYLGQDYATAERLYDTAADGGDVFSDPYMHAFRADTYERVGRPKDAIENARLSWRMISGELRFDGLEVTPLDDDQKSYLLALILPILKTGGDPGFEPALAAYRAIPAKDWVGWGQRAAVLNQLGDTPGALAASAEALKAQPANPGVLNNHCYILAQAGRPAEGLPYCEKAVQSAPEFAPLRHSLASALAGAGRCQEAEVQLAEARRIDPASVLYSQPIACTPAA